jgi:hypothetical protein
MQIHNGVGFTPFHAWDENDTSRNEQAYLEMENMLNGKTLLSIKRAVFLHRTDWNGKANHSSKGCMIIDGRQWRNVETQLKKSSNIFLRINR